MNEAYCRKCGGIWDEPELFEEIIFKNASKLFRSNKTVEGISYLREKTGISLKGAKGIYLHTTREKGMCHKCNSKLECNEKTECTNCGSLNYDW